MRTANMVFSSDRPSLWRMGKSVRPVRALRMRENDAAPIGGWAGKLQTGRVTLSDGVAADRENPCATRVEGGGTNVPRFCLVSSFIGIR